jgi:hypothetical protein
MPLYTFEHPDSDGNGPFIDVLQRMKDDHEYIDKDGAKWKRVFSVPNASIDTRIDDFSSNEFVNKTKDKGMTMGQLWEESKRASGRREKMLGKDPVKEKYFKNYSKKRSGMKHDNDPTKKTPGTIDIG